MNDGLWNRMQEVGSEMDEILQKFLVLVEHCLGDQRLPKPLQVGENVSHFRAQKVSIFSPSWAKWILLSQIFLYNIWFSMNTCRNAMKFEF